MPQEQLFILAIHSEYLQGSFASHSQKRASSGGLISALELLDARAQLEQKFLLSRDDTGPGKPFFLSQNTVFFPDKLQKLVANLKVLLYCLRALFLHPQLSSFRGTISSPVAQIQLT